LENFEGEVDFEEYFEVENDAEEKEVVEEGRILRRRKGILWRLWRRQMLWRMMIKRLHMWWILRRRRGILRIRLCRRRT
jgi:hypothetical protein